MKTKIKPIIKKRGNYIYFNIFKGHHFLLNKNGINLSKLFIFLVFIISTLVSFYFSKLWVDKNCFCEPEIIYIKEDIKPTPTVIQKKVKVVTGKVSFYSHDGCLGCNKLQITASGERFDENANTMACNQFPLNTYVLVTNLDTGVTAIAKVNDRGGFEKYNRIADLSKGLFEKLNAKTDITNIKIEEI